MRRQYALALCLLTSAACGSRTNGTSSPVGDATPGQPGMPGEPDPTPTPDPSPTMPTADTLSFRMIGRMDTSDPAGPRMAYPLSGVEAAFMGTRFAINVRMTRPIEMNPPQPLEDSLDVVIDGVSAAPVVLSPGLTHYEVAQNLKPTAHTVQFIKRTESRWSTLQWLGFETDNPAVTTQPMAASNRRIEFIGDSITTGYGALGATPQADICMVNFGENADASFAALTARALKADPTVVAWAGIGVLHPVPTGETAQVIFSRTLAYDATSHWAFGTAPQAVVVNLGTNDTVEAAAAPAAFVAAYQAMLADVRHAYPNACILAVTGPMLHGPDLTLIQPGVAQAVAALQAAGDKNLHTLVIPEDDGSRGKGCYDHPSVATQQLMAQKVSESLSSILDWK